MAYPGPKVHRVSRRKLGRGQYPNISGTQTTATPSGSTVVLTWSQPVVVRGNLAITVATLTFVSQVINSPTQVTITMSGAVATHAYSFNGNQPNISASNGGAVSSAAGTF